MVPTRIRWYVAYPALLAIVPVLYEQAQNPWMRVGEAVGACVVVVGAVLAVQSVAYTIARAALRDRGRASADLAAAVTVLGVVAFYTAPAIADVLHRLVTYGRRAVVLPLVVGIAAIALVVRRLRRTHPRTRIAEHVSTVSQFVALVSVLLVMWSSARIALSGARAAWAIQHSALIHELARPVVSSHTVAGPQRDLYILLLDEYAAAEPLRELYGIDNTPFLDSLRALGFRTPAAVRSNYSVTLLSVGSLLNFAHTAPLADAAPAGYRGWALGGYLLEHNRAARFLKARGYRFVMFPSALFGPTRHNAEADAEFADPPARDLAHLVYTRWLIADVFSASTVLGTLLQTQPTYQDVTAAHDLGTFAGVGALAARPIDGRPVFAFAHVLMPHEPFIVDAACRPIRRGEPLLNDDPPASADVRAALAGEIACLNRQVLTTVHGILARPGPRPIIILQGDHGTQGLRPFDTYPRPLSRAQVRERFRPFGAYYLPDGGAAAMPDTVGIINVLRVVFNRYYGTDFRLLPNTMYFSHWAYPYTLVPIDTALLIPTPATR